MKSKQLRLLKSQKADKRGHLGPTIYRPRMGSRFTAPFRCGMVRLDVSSPHIVDVIHNRLLQGVDLMLMYHGEI